MYAECATIADVVQKKMRIDATYHRRGDYRGKANVAVLVFDIVVSSIFDGFQNWGAILCPDVSTQC